MKYRFGGIQNIGAGGGGGEEEGVGSKIFHPHTFGVVPVMT